MRIKERLLIFSAYLFGIPALYIVLTDYRKSKEIGYHGAQAFLLWAVFFIIFFTIRFNLDQMFMVQYVPQAELLEPISAGIMGAYALFCGIRGGAGIHYDKK